MDKPLCACGHPAERHHWQHGCQALTGSPWAGFKTCRCREDGKDK